MVILAFLAYAADVIALASRHAPHVKDWWTRPSAMAVVRDCVAGTASIPPVPETHLFVELASELDIIADDAAAPETVWVATESILRILGLVHAELEMP